MSANGRSAVVKTWYELVRLTFAPIGDTDRSFIETPIGLFPTITKLHKRAKRYGLRYVNVPLTAERQHVGTWFVEHFSRETKGYYYREVDLVHEYGRKSAGRIVSDQWVYPYGERKGGPRRLRS